MSASFVVPARFCGPPRSANGGWVSGHAAALLATGADRPAVTVRLLSPPPLDRPMQVRRDGDNVEVLAGDRPVLQARPAPALTGGVPGPISFAAAVAAGDSFPGLVDHPFPTCFVCGTDRVPGDALALRPGPVPGGGADAAGGGGVDDGRGRDGGDGVLHAAAWVPTETSTELVWAALDCPGAWALDVGGRPMVLGTMTAQVLALPVPGAEHVVLGWRRGGSGRKHFSGTALYTGDGRLLARAEAVWIQVDPAAILPAGEPAAG
ncbi:hypothetical protein MF406_09610 [Georgenia sp. TF02-10]|uniref:hypothetical protein n=1 Tax=Georgenia sp. TF02-10 TaxID=2917725 RepID=UPI001FA7342D|nr:hypothetical protein [Georgenia sp. TF02-10]UNX53283.1 hypothetical protein MF406_09610 [Georgenia sp. TF02-10]